MRIEGWRILSKRSKVNHFFHWNLKMTSILDGVDEIIDNNLQLEHPTRFGIRSPKYFTKQAYLDLSSLSGPSNPKLRGCVQEMMEKIRSNAELWQRPYNGQARDWDWVQALNVSDQSTSLEKLLEKLIVKSSEKNEGSIWANQVPTCNGFEGSNARRIDLVRKHPDDSDAYQFIELKFGNAEQNWGSNHPLYAAFEILKYGLLYLLCREKNLINEKYKLAKAKQVDLIVLAPIKWYGTEDRLLHFSWLVDGINDGLKMLLPDDSAIKMSFHFCGITQDATEDLVTFLSRSPIDWEQSQWTGERFVDSWIVL